VGEEELRGVVVIFFLQKDPKLSQSSSIKRRRIIVQIRADEPVLRSLPHRALRTSENSRVLLTYKNLVPRYSAYVLSLFQASLLLLRGRTGLTLIPPLNRLSLEREEVLLEQALTVVGIIMPWLIRSHV